MGEIVKGRNEEGRKECEHLGRFKWAERKIVDIDPFPFS